MQSADLGFKTIPRMMEMMGDRFGSKIAVVERGVQLRYAYIREGMRRAGRSMIGGL